VLVLITPIYGNGWTDGERTIREPEPFQISLEDKRDKTFRGRVISKGHVYDGYNLEASRAFTNDDSVFNCTLKADGGETIYGYCRIG
jgi:hypothetical protein